MTFNHHELEIWKADIGSKQTSICESLGFFEEVAVGRQAKTDLGSSSPCLASASVASTSRFLVQLSSLPFPAHIDDPSPPTKTHAGRHLTASLKPLAQQETLPSTTNSSLSCPDFEPSNHIFLLMASISTVSRLISLCSDFSRS